MIKGLTVKEAVLAGLIAAGVLTAWKAQADYYPPLQEGFKFPSISVVDENDQPLSLPRDLVGSSPVLLLPVFTQCTMACPLMVKALLDTARTDGGRALASYQIVVFSFDSSDRGENLRHFRKRHGVPIDWKVVRSPNANAIKSFFDDFGYSFMLSDGGFAHPNQMMVFNSSGVWTGSLFGSAISASELLAASREPYWFFKPQNWVLVGGLGIALSLLGFLFGLARRKKTAREMPKTAHPSGLEPLS
jgi:cytochrome oxidase Cu insertion factor (SCO1/SenC/PrrC family)